MNNMIFILFATLTALTSRDEYFYSSPKMTEFTGDVNRKSPVIRREDIAWLTEAGCEYNRFQTLCFYPERTNTAYSTYYDTIPIKAYNVGYLNEDWGFIISGGCKGEIYSAAYSGTNEASFFIRDDVSCLDGPFKINNPISDNAIRSLIYNQMLSSKDPWLKVSTNFPAGPNKPVKKEYISSAFEDTKKFKRFVMFSYSGSWLNIYPSSGTLSYHDRSWHDTTNDYPGHEPTHSDDISNREFGGPGYEHDWTQYFFWQTGIFKERDYIPDGEGDETDVFTLTSWKYDENNLICDNPCITIFGRDSYFEKPLDSSKPKLFVYKLYGIFEVDYEAYDSVNDGYNEQQYRDDYEGYVVIELKAEPKGPWMGKLSEDTSKIYSCGWELDIEPVKTTRKIMNFLNARGTQYYNNLIPAPKYDVPPVSSEIGIVSHSSTSIGHWIRLVGFIGIFDIKFHTSL